MDKVSSVIPAKAGIQVLFEIHGRVWIPAFAGMTVKGIFFLMYTKKSCCKTTREPLLALFDTTRMCCGSNAAVRAWGSCEIGRAHV